MKKYEADQRTDQRMNRQPNHHPDRLTLLQPSRGNHDIPDVDMESEGTYTYQPLQQKAEYDQDDLWMAEPRRPQVATTGMSTGASAVTQKIRISAISELK